MEPSLEGNQSFNHRANELIVSGCYAEAEALLGVALHQMPAGWKPQKDDGRTLKIAFWDQQVILESVVSTRWYDGYARSGKTFRLQIDLMLETGSAKLLSANVAVGP
jgi:hypothetical protein